MSARAKDLDSTSVGSSSNMGGDELTFADMQRTDEEKICVSVRVRPLNEREVISDWECINKNTIIFKTNMPDRSMYPTAYTFDRVFGTESSTEQVYEEAAKEIALAAVSGINSSIFAYGQTSSGKTYTMSGITEFAVADIYEYIDKHKEREFVLKFSAMEIYNEAVRDLLSTDSTPLRVLDDPERGTVVEKLTEEVLTDWKHLQELLSICEAQRQIGETSLNENSSRSHQILRLTIESCAYEYVGAQSSTTLTATLNFIDLAGSERAAQTLNTGLRLKEGSHINRSLLTLGTVIRKLSKGGNGHIPYRDSKLTRILQNSLGGNARTAIICTMSPARCHVEQSRNTLLFGSCAKEVSTNAQVNVVMSDKVLVKQLQKEVTRLESQLRSRGSISRVVDSAALKEKDLLIEQMDKEIKELIWQRDLAQSRVESLLKSVADDQLSRIDEYSASEASEVVNPLQLDVLRPQDNFLVNKDAQSLTSPDVRPGWEETAQRNNEECEDICKEVRCIENEENFGRTGSINERAVSSAHKLNHINSETASIAALKLKIHELHRTINYLEKSSTSEAGRHSISNGLKWTRSRSKGSILMTIPSSLWSEMEQENEDMPTTASEKDFSEEPEGFEENLLEMDHDAKIRHMSRENSQNSSSNAYAEESIKEIDIHVDDTTSVLDYDTGVNKSSNLQSENQTADILVPDASPKTDGTRERNRTERGRGNRQHHTNWPIKFERYRRKIIELWARCNVPLVHRSYFFMLFKGDPSDSVYMEVELRRLYFLKDTLARGTNEMITSQIVPPATTSLKALNREREMLARQLQKKYTKKERAALYQEWGIDIETKQRSLQLARRLWSDQRDTKHIKESAALVAKLVGFVEPRYAPKEMFGLSFLTPSMTPKSSSWRDNMSSLL